MLRTEMAHRDTESWLVVLLRPSLTMALSLTDPGSGFVADGARYSQAYQGDVVATFDRLVDEGGRIVGIQVWPVAAQTAGFLRALPTRSYLRVVDERPYLQVYFDSDGTSEPESGGEQSLVGAIYRAGSSEFAIAVDLAGLGVSEADVEAIRGANGRWVALQS